MKLDDDIAIKLTSKGIVAVLIIDKAVDAVPLAETLMEGGVDAMELTLRTEAALPSLEAIRNKVPEMLAGIGTILTPEQVIQAKNSGASFGVSPGTNLATIEAAIDIGLPFAPGIMTPSDIETTLSYECEILKFFPAGSSGGIKHLKNISAPYNHLGLKYIPLGGINEANMNDYLSENIIAAVGGSWIASRENINSNNWQQIKANAQSAILNSKRTTQ
ncbi:MAG: bifunctional 4-hydroxy-2-oxoglutarate aldolase/2-dehydro-3-deoxy-phosphogluconate aldolase [Verrucomicrobiota bacterium]|nr:bifunctional 4-hydroxy-2-oxoglutarate aldolase/2-dehydro-3-deoxy-phosphogluconate aldolase [Verrucomicrobiota bacterium]|tara:strand:+ start:131 stop:784 length:654 start_codon:yes stop_codon:yes gene_type:complete